MEKNAKLKSYNGKINKDYLGKNPRQKRLLFYLFGRNGNRLIIYLEEYEYGEKKAKKSCYIKEKIAVPNSDESDKNNDESIE